MERIDRRGGNRVRRDYRTPTVTVDSEPVLSDGDPLRTYGYCAVRQTTRGEWLDRMCVGRDPKDVNECVIRERVANPLFDTNNPVVRVARVTIVEG